ncbi:hypothetical protein MXE38_10170 [Anaerobiospirillum sp. NML120448]|uniref:hypothetical protein n=1 Tax=Anaerobiospirillum sp. NML120448 TaxID=2932816 RepID=UPI001FF440BA|nr:hypothetical protein [Anaerobiospirillum sp. NML120448]MCK0515200.1 hypothetical protein [Anaerobiospirillum sp. NML120448]
MSATIDMSEFSLGNFEKKKLLKACNHLQLFSQLSSMFEELPCSNEKALSNCIDDELNERLCADEFYDELQFDLMQEDYELECEQDCDEEMFEAFESGKCDYDYQLSDEDITMAALGSDYSITQLNTEPAPLVVTTEPLVDEIVVHRNAHTTQYFLNSAFHLFNYLKSICSMEDKHQSETLNAFLAHNHVALDHLHQLSLAKKSSYERYREEMLKIVTLKDIGSSLFDITYNMRHIPSYALPKVQEQVPSSKQITLFNTVRVINTNEEPIKRLHYNKVNKLHTSSDCLILDTIHKTNYKLNKMLVFLKQLSPATTIFHTNIVYDFCSYDFDKQFNSSLSKFINVMLKPFAMGKHKENLTQICDLIEKVNPPAFSDPRVKPLYL